MFEGEFVSYNSHFTVASDFASIHAFPLKPEITGGGGYNTGNSGYYNTGTYGYYNTSHS